MVGRGGGSGPLSGSARRGVTPTQECDRCHTGASEPAPLPAPSRQLAHERNACHDDASWLPWGGSGGGPDGDCTISKQPGINHSYSGSRSGHLQDLWAGVDPPSSEPLAPCRWNMALIGADDAGGGRGGVRVGIIDSGIDLEHPDIAEPGRRASCSFISSDDPAILGLAPASEAGNGDCTNKDAVDDINGHGTHVASIVASP